MKNGQATALLETKSGQKLLRGTWVDMHDKSVSFNHMLDKHRGNVGSCRIYVSSKQTCL